MRRKSLWITRIFNSVGSLKFANEAANEKILTSNSFLVWNHSLVQGFHAQHANACHPHKSHHKWWFYDQTVFLPNKVAVIFLKICKPFESLQKEFHHLFSLKWRYLQRGGCCIATIGKNCIPHLKYSHQQCTCFAFSIQNIWGTRSK